MPFSLYTDIDTDFPTTDVVGKQLAAIEAIDGQSWTRSVEEPSSVVDFLSNQSHDLGLGHDRGDCSLDELLGLTSWSYSNYISCPVRTHQGRSDATQVVDNTGKIPFVLQFRPLAARDDDDLPKPGSAEKASACCIALQTGMKRRRTEVNDRTDGKSSPKYAKRSIEDTLASSSAASSGDNGAPADHEGDALRINTQTSSETDFEDDVPEDGSIPDTVPVSEQGLPPSQPTSSAHDNGGPRQAPYMSTPWNCHICLEGFHREKEHKNHCLTDKHARREAEIGDIQGDVKGPRPFKCEEHACQKAFGRKDALMRHAFVPSMPHNQPPHSAVLSITY